MTTTYIVIAFIALILLADVILGYWAYINKAPLSWVIGESLVTFIICAALYSGFVSYHVSKEATVVTLILLTVLSSVACVSIFVWAVLQRETVMWLVRASFFPVMCSAFLLWLTVGQPLLGR